MVKKTYIALLLLFMAVFSLNAQSSLTVSGTVRDSQGQPVIGANG